MHNNIYIYEILNNIFNMFDILSRGKYNDCYVIIKFYVIMRICILIITSIIFHVCIIMTLMLLLCSVSIHCNHLTKNMDGTVDCVVRLLMQVLGLYRILPTMTIMPLL